MLEGAVESIANSFNHYHVGIYLVDGNFEFAYLQAASSQIGKKMQGEGFRIELRNLGFTLSRSERNKAIIKLNLSGVIGPTGKTHLPESQSQILLGIYVKDVVFGFLDVQSKFLTDFTTSHIEALQTTANQLSMSIENAILRSETRVIDEQLGALSAKRLRESWRDRDGENMASYQYTPLGVQQVLGDHKVEDASDSRTLIIPVNLRNQKLGTLRVRRRGADAPWDGQDREIIQEIASQMGLALENARLLEDAQRRVAREQEISEMTTHIGASFDVDTILRITAQEIGKALGDTEVSVMLSQKELTPPTNIQSRIR